MLSDAKKAKIAAFDPNGIGNTAGNLFGLPFDYDDSAVIVIPVPWEVTVSYSDGTANAPQAILDASPQLDLFDFDVPHAWQYGIYMLPVSQKCVKTNADLREKAYQYIQFLEKGGQLSQQASMHELLKNINQECHALKEFVKRQSLTAMNDGKLVGVLGGDHSTPLGLMEAIGQYHGDFGILQIDAHADLRNAYEGFVYSHASIMFNALQLNNVQKLVSVGIRDICEAEVQLVNESKGRVVAFYDHDIQRKVKIEQQLSWASYCQQIVEQLPHKVYISFDIDGLDPKLCPHTGTPVAGGLEMSEAVYLLKTVVDSGRQIVGFDLCEVCPTDEDEWDANVGARVLYKLAILTALSQEKA